MAITGPGSGRRAGRAGRSPRSKAKDRKEDFPAPRGGRQAGDESRPRGCASRPDAGQIRPKRGRACGTLARTTSLPAPPLRLAQRTNQPWDQPTGGNQKPERATATSSAPVAARRGEGHRFAGRSIRIARLRGPSLAPRASRSMQIKIGRSTGWISYPRAAPKQRLQAPTPPGAPSDQPARRRSRAAVSSHISALKRSQIDAPIQSALRERSCRCKASRDSFTAIWRSSIGVIESHISRHSTNCATSNQ